MYPIALALAVLVALAIDRLWGDPPAWLFWPMKA
jgi:hypothetical protein